MYVSAYKGKEMKVGVKSRADNVSLWMWICERKTREIRCVSCAAFDPTFISILVFLLHCEHWTLSLGVCLLLVCVCEYELYIQRYSI